MPTCFIRIDLFFNCFLIRFLTIFGFLYLKLKHFNFSLISSFIIVTFFLLTLFVKYLQLKQWVFPSRFVLLFFLFCTMFCNDSNIFLTISFKHFDFIKWFSSILILIVFLNFFYQILFFLLILFIWLINVIAYFTKFNILFIISFIGIGNFNYHKFTTKLFFYCFLCFYFSSFISVRVSFFINSYC